MASLTLRVIPHLGVIIDLNNEWPRSVTVCVSRCPSCCHPFAALRLGLRPLRSSASSLKTPVGFFSAAALVNNYCCTQAGNCDPLLYWLAYCNFYRHVCDTLRKTLTFKSLIFHLKVSGGIFIWFCAEFRFTDRERRSWIQLWKQKIPSQPVRKREGFGVQDPCSSAEMEVFISLG